MIFLNHWLLTILLLIPAAGCALVLLVRPARAVRRTAIGVALVAFCIALVVLILFKRKPAPYEYAPAGAVQMACSAEILPAMRWNYRVAVDGLSLPFIIVTSLIALFACMATPHDREQARWFFAMLLCLETGALGVFVSFDLLLLLAFLSLSLIPCCALLALHGQEHRGRTIVSFLIPMLIGLACLFVATLGERLMSTHGLVGGTLDLVRLASLRCAEPSLFLLMLIGFLLLLPVFPLHSWVAGVVKYSSPATVAMLAGLIPLIGGYGLLRVVIPLFPSIAASMWWVPAGIGLMMVLYFALCAIGTDDIRSAVVHIALSMSGFALIGVATLTTIGLSGAVIVLLSQSLLVPFSAALTAALKRDATRNESQLRVSPRLSLVWLIELVWPGLLGQIMVILGAFQTGGSGVARSANAWYALAGLMCLGLAFIGAAAFRIFPRTAVVNDSDIPRSEWASPLPVGVAVVLLATGVVVLCIAYVGGALTPMMSGLP